VEAQGPAPLLECARPRPSRPSGWSAGQASAARMQGWRARTDSGGTIWPCKDFSRMPTGSRSNSQPTKRTRTSSPAFAATTLAQPQHPAIATRNPRVRMHRISRIAHRRPCQPVARKQAHIAHIRFRKSRSEFGASSSQPSRSRARKTTDVDAELKEIERDSCA
jgi:hypothetical protein